jgi:hypothetical protein
VLAAEDGSEEGEVRPRRVNAGRCLRGGGYFDQALAGPLSVGTSVPSNSSDVIGFRCTR